MKKIRNHMTIIFNKISKRSDKNSGRILKNQNKKDKDKGLGKDLAVL